ncbi:hypothetical protein CAEBREN_13988 [Caenorhabditis brenneri]|uniref:DUF19 domain-containing protein n=1 Tax=Caenorhabditis brenneri TaxID=135651 RepID=G0MQH4_CAEBE|nr:hypothetical protein CAEBREN_13988 [Caenorhabditis brenneri]
MLPFFLLGFFPNLHNLHPAELSDTYGVLGRRVDTPNCTNGSFYPLICLMSAKQNRNLSFSSYASPFWTMDGIMNYEKDVKCYECFKSNCSNVKQMETIHDKSLSVVKTVLGKAYSCLRDNHITAFNDIEICARGVRSFSDYLTFCTKPAIRNFKCKELRYFFPKAGQLSSQECERELLIADECFAQITENHHYHKKPGFLWKKHEMQPYQKDISESRCLKHSDCQNILFALELYENSSSILEDVFENGYECLRKKFETISFKMDECLKVVRINTFSDMLNNCSRPIINELDCEKDEIEALNKAINKSLSITELYSESTVSSGAHIGLISCVLIMLGFLFAFF